MIIHPEIFTTPDSPTIKFRVPKEQIDLDVELPRILHAQGWGCGTYFHVQFVDHDRTKLFSSARYVVTEETEVLHTSDANPYQPMTRTVYARKAEIVGEWQYFGTLEDLEGEKVKIIEDGAVIKWNPGKKKHELKRRGKVIYANSDKKEVEKVANAQ